MPNGKVRPDRATHLNSYCCNERFMNECVNLTLITSCVLIKRKMFKKTKTKNLI